MRKSRFTDEQIIAILQESAADGKTGELIRRHGISRETFYKWRRKYGGLQLDQAKRLRALEDENRRLKRVVADQALNIQVLKDLLGKTMRTASLRRDAVHRAMTAATILAKAGTMVANWRNYGGTPMATLNVKNLPDALYRQLQRRARRERRSVAQEVAHILEAVLSAPEPTSILAIQGLGKDVWQRIDAVEHVRTERRSWR
jgi:putative transposase